MFQMMIVMPFLITLSSASEDLSHISACQGQPTKMIACQIGKIIFVQNAVYGSFKSGDCGVPVSQDCEADVTKYIESKCSGLERCNVTAADDYLMSNAHEYNPPCDKSLAKSLEVKFHCKKYYNSLEDECQNKQIVVTSKHGFLSGFLTKQTAKGSFNCPWSFIVSSTQTLLLSLWDFGVWKYERSEETNKCLVYAYVKSVDFATTICPGKENKKLFYSKSDGTVNVTMFHGDGQNYLIEFKIVDCPTYVPPKFLRNIGSLGTSLSLECLEGSGKVLTISCVNGVWPHVSRSNCSLPDEISTVLTNDSHPTANSTLLIVGVIALAVIISLLIIFVGLYCLNACPFQKDHDINFCSNAATAHMHSLPGKYSSENLFLRPTQSARELYPMLTNHDHRVAAMQRDYATTLQMRQMASHYADITGWCPTHGPYHLGSATTIDKKYNTSKMKRNLSTPLSNCAADLYSDKPKHSVSPPSSPFYHELDQVTLKTNVEPEDQVPSKAVVTSSNGYTRTPV